jgi:hypothetical protein
MEDVRYLYQTELPMAVRIVEARIVRAEMLAAAQGQSGAAKQALLLESQRPGPDHLRDLTELGHRQGAGLGV